MKFVIGLLIGTLGILALASAKDFSWKPPKRSSYSAITQPSEPEQAVIVEQQIAPIKSVTIEPLDAEPAPKRAPQPVVQASVPVLTPDKTPLDSSLQEELPMEQSAAEPPAPPAMETAIVWKPFHSEVSADGFARRLSTQLGYPFRALREGPAKYYVVFDYDSQEQRELLRGQVEALIGFSAI